jgi:hypothetical protein
MTRRCHGLQSTYDHPNHIQKIFFPSFTIPEFNSDYNWCPTTNKPNSSELEETLMCVNTTARAELNYRQVVVADMVHRYNMTLKPIQELPAS